MLGKLIPVLIVVIGLGAGAGAGLFLRPAPAVVAAAEHDGKAKPADNTTEAKDPDAEATEEYVKLSNQFVVPVVEGGRVAALVVLSLSLEVPAGGSDAVFLREPKLRDSFLQVLFEHANSGGFRGTFTDSANLVVLRRALKEAAVQVMGKMATDVLIVDIVRQDS